MRDHFYHKKEIMGGMWGMKNPRDTNQNLHVSASSCKLKGIFKIFFIQFYGFFSAIWPGLLGLFWYAASCVEGNWLQRKGPGSSPEVCLAICSKGEAQKYSLSPCGLSTLCGAQKLQKSNLRLWISWGKMCKMIMNMKVINLSIQIKLNVMLSGGPEIFYCPFCAEHHYSTKYVFKWLFTKITRPTQSLFKI